MPPRLVCLLDRSPSGAARFLQFSQFKPVYPAPPFACSFCSCCLVGNQVFSCACSCERGNLKRDRLQFQLSDAICCSIVSCPACRPEVHYDTELLFHEAHRIHSLRRQYSVLSREPGVAMQRRELPGSRQLLSRPRVAVSHYTPTRACDDAVLSGQCTAPSQAGSPP